MNRKSLLLLPLLLIGASLSACQADSTFVPESEVIAQGYKKIDFEFFCHDNEEAFDTVYYKDAFFETPASETGIEFAHASCAWALANFPYDFQEKVDYSNKSKNARELASKMGFEDFEVNDCFKVRPGTDSIGLTCSRKKLTIQEEEKTILLVGIRGAGYTSEWVSNFNIGGDGLHHGFHSAADQAIAFVNSYIESRHISGAIKLWVSGYSRAAATTNLFAGLIDEGIRDHHQVLSEQVSYGKDDIYAQCFEPPQGAIDEAEVVHGPDFNNIHCYLNPHDMVPLVAPTGFGFSRYGVEHYYPTSTRTLEYYDLEKKPRTLLDEIIKDGHPKYKPYALNDFFPQSSAQELGDSHFGPDTRKKHWQVETEVRSLLDLLAIIGIGGRDEYLADIQPGMCETLRLVFDHPETEESPFMPVIRELIPELMNIEMTKTLIDDLLILDLHSYFAADFAPFLIRAYQRALPETPLEEIQCIANGLSGLITAFANVAFIEPGLVSSLVSMTNISALTYAHFPEINYCWIKAMSPLFYREPVPADFTLTWQKVALFGVKSAEAYDEYGNIVAKILNGQPIEYDERYTFGVRTSFKEDSFVFYFPSKNEYTVRVNLEDANIVTAYYEHFYFDNRLSEEALVKEGPMEFENGQYEILEVSSLG